MNRTAQGNTWKKIALELTKDFLSWGCPYDRKKLPELAMGYECTPLFFWNWMDGEAERTEKGFLRVLGYAWRKHLEEEAEPAAIVSMGTVPNDTLPGGGISCFGLAG